MTKDTEISLGPVDIHHTTAVIVQAVLQALLQALVGPCHHQPVLRHEMAVGAVGVGLQGIRTQGRQAVAAGVEEAGSVGIVVRGPVIGVAVHGGGAAVQRTDSK